ncbi:MAG: PQQ-dependent sugar dehydrogenase [Pseudomonadota bacterium]
MRAIALALLLLSAPVLAQPKVESLVLPPGFQAEVFAKDLRNARSMTLGAKGTLFVGTRDAGVVYAIEHDGVAAKKVHTIARGLNMPNGVAFRDGALYVAEVNRILRFDGIESALADPPQPVVVADDLPTERHHGWKFIAFGPDGKLYVPVGAPCNVCDEGDPFATILRMDPDGGKREVFARGVRNTVGFDWHPKTGHLWFTDNGRDWMGDDLPPCELNVAVRMGQHFGYPYCHGTSVVDPEFGDGHACKDFTPPAVDFGAHTAPLGMRFYEGAMFPAAYRGGTFVAQRGSWNRSRKVGYQVLFVPVEGDKAGAPQPFLSGFLDGEKALGRPVDVQELPDGSLLVSDDTANAIYRITYAAPAASAAR